MKRLSSRLLALVLGLAVFAVAGLSDANAATVRPSTASTQQAGTPIVGHAHGTAPNGASFAGRFTPDHFVRNPHHVVAVGSLTGTLTRAGGRTQHVDKTAKLPVTKSDFLGKRGSSSMASDAAAHRAGTCQILNLVLGPLNLNLLGLQVHLNRVHLNITAATGPGNLLGNLLCAVAGLLDGTGLGGLSGALGKLTDVLNQILSALGG
ncbi:MAG TPA: hypothetical protein VGH30_01730 [Jatrophihabitantaceae bacterium]|jgi:hypothetical protein